MFETSVSPPAPLNLEIEYQNADLWSLWGGCERTPCTPPGYGPVTTILVPQTNCVRVNSLLLCYNFTFVPEKFA